MGKSSTKLVLEWIVKAEEDLGVAQRELRVRRSPALSAICFHAQQCAEKYLKARLCSLGAPIPRTHDLLTLLDGLRMAHPEWRVLEPAAKSLVHYAVSFRYPGESADRKQARAAVGHANLVREVVRFALDLPCAARRTNRRKARAAVKRSRKERKSS